MTDTDPPPEGLALEAFSRPVRGGNAFEATLARLLQLIRLGIVAPGEALAPERELAARLEVSRDTVREAIKALAEAGYVESRRGRYGGTFVREPLPHPEEGRGERVAQSLRSAGLIAAAYIELCGRRRAIGGEGLPRPRPRSSNEPAWSLRQ